MGSSIVIVDEDWELIARRFYNARLINLLEMGLFSFNSVSDLRGFKNKHPYKRCFIVANGPSLTFKDLDCLAEHNELSFGVNQVFRAFDKTRWRPSYYLTSDMNVANIYADEIRNMDAPVVFMHDKSEEFWKTECGDKVHRYRLEYALGFSADASRVLFGYGTVIHVCLQMAMYMGFIEIYLIGADMKYNFVDKGAQNHFIPNYYKLGKDEPGQTFDYESSFLAYQYVKHYAQRNGVKVYNATRGGNLEVFDRVNFDDLF